jgi:hypothetical protein
MLLFNELVVLCQDAPMSIADSEYLARERVALKAHPEDELFGTSEGFGRPVTAEHYPVSRTTYMELGVLGFGTRYNRALCGYPQLINRPIVWFAPTMNCTTGQILVDFEVFVPFKQLLGGDSLFD